MFAINKEGRSFLRNNFITIRNGFQNDGLVTFACEYTFNDLLNLEKLYFSALNRNIGNRVLTLSISFDAFTLKCYNEIFRWIKAHQHEHNVKL